MSDSNKDTQNDLVVEVMKLLNKFQPGGERGPIEDRDEWERRMQSHAPPDRELLQELTRFAGLWRYFQEQKETIGPEILDTLKEVPKLAVNARVDRMRQINHKLMERISNASEGSKFRN
jgi:hypothetical protein